jgi:hypothetical protein
MVHAAVPDLGVNFLGSIHNISRSGISVIAPQRIEKGSFVKLGIRYFGQAKELLESRMEGEVAFHLTGTQFTILGIAFQKIITHADPHLFQIISSLEVH